MRVGSAWATGEAVVKLMSRGRAVMIQIMFIELSGRGFEWLRDLYASCMIS